MALDPHHAHVGDTMDAGATWSDCGRHSVYIKTRVAFTGPCGPVGRGHGHGRVSRHVSFFWLTPEFSACRGTYRVTAAACHGGQLRDRMTRRVHVKD